MKNKRSQAINRPQHSCLPRIPISESFPGERLHRRRGLGGGGGIGGLRTKRGYREGIPPPEPSGPGPDSPLHHVTARQPAPAPLPSAAQAAAPRHPAAAPVLTTDVAMSEPEAACSGSGGVTTSSRVRRSRLLQHQIFRKTAKPAKR